MSINEANFHFLRAWVESPDYSVKLSVGDDLAMYCSGCEL